VAEVARGEGWVGGEVEEKGGGGNGWQGSKKAMGSKGVGGGVEPTQRTRKLKILRILGR